MRFQKLFHPRRFVRGEIVGDDVNLLVFWLAAAEVAQEGDELRAGVARGGISGHFSGARVQRGAEGKCSVAEIFNGFRKCLNPLLYRPF